MKKISLILSGFLAVFVVGFMVTKTHAYPSSLTIDTTATATTTRTFVGNGTATSTYQFDSYPTYNPTKPFSMGQMDAEYLYVQAEASSTATVFGITPQFSNNGVDWYTYGTLTGLNVTSTTTYTWQPATVATSSMTFKLPTMYGMHERVLVSGSGAAGAIYMEVVMQKQPSNP